jgi:DNA-binding SARP family transcriptional activator/tetratricopeptide (TPR) repeat protein
MRYGILGTFEVWAGGRPVPIGGPKPRALLALLLLNAGRVVPTSQILEALWAGRPPASGATRVQGLVAQVRASLARAGVLPGPIGTHPDGYLLTVGDGELDLDAFERRLRQARTAAAEGDLAAAASAFRAGLGLWRGKALAGVAAPFAGSEAARLEERRLVAVEELTEVELARGRHADLVGELAALVVKHPRWERLRERLMLALYRSGRQAEALEVYRQGHRLLVDELGLEPGPDLRRLQRAILAGDPGLLLAAGTAAGATSRPAPVVDPPAQLPPDIADFTGRREQVARLRAALGSARPPRAVAIAVLSGKPGVGKTALAVHVAHRLRPDFPDGQLQVDLGGAERRPLAPDEVLDRFLRALGIAGAAVPATLEERRDLYRSRLADRRVLIVLDNAADEAQVRPLLPGSPSCAVMVTSRGRLAALDGALRFDVDVLDARHTVKLLAWIAGPARVAAEADAADTIGRLCGHLPLAVRVAGARLAVREHWRLADLVDLLADERRRLDELKIADLEVRASLALSYQGLGDEARRLLRRLGLLAASSFAAWVGAAALNCTLTRAERLLEELVDAQLVEVHGTDTAGQVRFRLHDLVRLYARERAAAEEPEAERRAALARSLGAWLALAEAADQVLTLGGASIVHAHAPRWWCPPELSALTAAQPAAWLEIERVNLLAGVRQACQAGLAELACDLTAASATFSQLGAYEDDWRDVHRLADAAARAAGDTRGRAALLVGLGWVLSGRTPPAEVRPTFVQARESFQRLGDLPGTVQALLGEGHCLRLTGQLAQALACLERARSLAVRAGAPDQEGAALFLTSLVDREQGHLDRALGRLRLILPAWRARGARRSEALTVRAIGLVLRDQGHLAAAEAHLADALALAGDLGDRQNQLRILVELGELRCRMGELDTARAALDLALRRSRQLRLRYDEARALHAHGQLHAAEGRLDDAAGCLAEAVRLWRRIGIPRELARALDTLGSIHAQTGDPAAAAAAWREAFGLLTTVNASAAEAVARRLGQLTKA